MMIRGGRRYYFMFQIWSFFLSLHWVVFFLTFFSFLSSPVQMLSWNNPLPIGKSAQSVTHPQERVSGVVGKRFSQVIARRRVMACEGWVCGPLAHTGIPSPVSLSNGIKKFPTPSFLQLAYFIVRSFIVPPASPYQSQSALIVSTGYIGGKRSPATRAVKTSPDFSGSGTTLLRSKKGSHWWTSFFPQNSFCVFSISFVILVIIMYLALKKLE